MDNFKEHLNIIKRDKLEDFYQVVRDSYFNFKGKKKVTSGEIITFLTNEVEKMNRCYTWFNLLDLLDKDYFENNRDKFHKLASVIQKEELVILNKKGVFDDNEFPLFVFFNRTSFTPGYSECSNFFANKKVYSSIPKDTFFEYALKHQEYDYLLYTDNFSNEDKKDFILDSIRDFNSEHCLTRLMMHIFSSMRGQSLGDIVPYEDFLDAIIKENKVKLITVDGLNSFYYHEGEFKEDGNLLFINKCYPYMNEKSQKYVRDKFPKAYAHHEKFLLINSLIQEIPDKTIKKRL